VREHDGVVELAQLRDGEVEGVLLLVVVVAGVGGRGRGGSRRRRRGGRVGQPRARAAEKRAARVAQDLGLEAVRDVLDVLVVRGDARAREAVGRREAVLCVRVGVCAGVVVVVVRAGGWRGEDSARATRARALGVCELRAVVDAAPLRLSLLTITSTRTSSPSDLRSCVTCKGARGA
jgi:hypothetical protein